MSSIVDKQGRFLGKVSLVDVVIILVVVALVLLAFVRFSQPAAAEVPIVTTLAMEKVRFPTVSVLDEGKDVYDEGGALLGQIESVTVTPTPLDVIRELPVDAPAPPAGDLVEKGASEIYSDVSITIQGVGQALPESYVVGGVTLRVGKALAVHGQGFDIKTVIMGIEVVES
ncbi:MAG: DUF4330 family protein [Gaiellales bacterium]|nr:DUF4330 family protein [Gaiellales bacterium]